MNKKERKFVDIYYEKGNDDFWQSQFKVDAETLGLSMEEFEKLCTTPLTEEYLETIDKTLLADEVPESK